MPDKINALVVNPYVADFKLYDEWMHPLGLYFLIDILTANNIDVHYFNFLERPAEMPAKKYGTGRFNFVELPKPDCFREIKRKYKLYGCEKEHFFEYCSLLPKIDVIFISGMMTYWIDGVRETIRVIRERYPCMPVVGGGVAMQLMPHFYHQNIPGIHIYDASLFPENGKVTVPGIAQTIIPPMIPSLRTAFEIMKMPLLHGPALLTLGCPLSCSYCASRILQPRFKRRPLEVIKEEILFLIQNGIQDISFFDDALLVNSEKLLIPFLKWIIKQEYKIRFHTPNGLHLVHVTEELLYLMRDAGFTTLRFGYESGRMKHRIQTGGKVDYRILECKLKLLQKIPFPDTGIYLMGGLPESSPDEMIDEMKFVGSFGVSVKPVFLSPVPGTALFNTYSTQFPILKTEPRSHNDTYFTTILPEWGEDGVEKARLVAKEINRRVRTGVIKKISDG